METQAAQNWIGLIGLLLLVGNLILFFLYLRATNRIKDASVAQSEGLAKPVVTLLRREAGVEALDLLDNVIRSQIAAGGYIHLVNIGTGPALELEWKIVRPPTRTFQ
ncbi:MAG: hypothetical protein WCA27_22450 [Candidatus Sulfotelmatobacter sp.]